MTPDEYCQNRVARSGSSLHYSVLFLPTAQRRAIAALYAYRREVDAAVEGVSDPAVAQAKLAWWGSEIERLYAGDPQHPVTRALAPHIEPFGISRERLMQVLDGARIDLSQTRYLDFHALAGYCDRVGGVAGELSARILGATDAGTLDFARKLGVALRLADIVRNVGRDARRGRIYLPIDELQRFGVKAADLLGARYVDGYLPLMQFQAQRARATYAEALDRLPAADRRAQRPGLIMAAISMVLLDEVERDGFRVLHQRVSLTPVRKLWIAWRIWVFGPAR